MGVVDGRFIFGALHPDTLAAAVSGLGFAVLYLRTRTLWAPIIAHAVYNLIVWVWEFCGVMSEGVDYYAYTLDQFRADWWFGAVGFVVVVLLIDRILRRREPLGPFALPRKQQRYT